MTTVQTIITNKSRNHFRIPLAKGKTKDLRVGESIRLDYDLRSFLSRAAQRDLDRALAKKIIELQTKVVTEDSTLTVMPDGTFTVKAGVEYDVKPEPKPQLPPQTKRESFDQRATGRVAGKSAEKLMKGMGMTTEDLDVGPKTEVDISTGKVTTPVTDGASVFATKNNLEPVDNVNVFVTDTKKETVDTKADEKVVEEKDSVVATPVEPTAEEPVDEEAYINELLIKKDFNLLYAYLADNHPMEFATVPKALIRKSKTYQDLKARLGI